ncbi:MAG: 2,3-bisphosphoglycerate-independent phosphoglycerate mutase [Rickettsiales bacterium]|nr:2,3-bisphosphoglycerate-independent phosphoglycerate mutase [Rickettsiales bacterium]
MPIPNTPLVLCILDGWGIRDESTDNAIAQANTPNWDQLIANYPQGVLDASEHEVGLPAGQMGNSEVGHMNIGAGRVVLQDLPRIDKAIDDGSLAENQTLIDYIEKLKKSGGTCHLMGLLSDGGVHAHQSHIIALAKIIAATGVKVSIHAFLDGRDTPPRSAKQYLETVEGEIAGEDNIAITTLCGRFFAMDRDQRWDRVKQAYNAIALGKGTTSESALAALNHAYTQADEGDEFVSPYIIGEYAGIAKQDGILMANFRADRAREILHALCDPTFDAFEREAPFISTALGMVEYSTDLSALMPSLFPPEELTELLGEIIAAQGMKQLRIAETEKYAHVTFFFNGGREEPYEGEDRILIPSPDVKTYDLKPEMSAPEVTNQLVEAIAKNAYPVIIVNYANTDMVGHCGKIDAAIQAVEAVDSCLGRLLYAINQSGGTLLITADHGNAEMMFNHNTGSAHTAHTLNKVPFIVAGPAYENAQTAIPDGRLADIAPTILQLLGIEIPPSMNGKALIDPPESDAQERSIG